MTDEEFRTFMANLAADFTAQLNESRIQFEMRQAQLEAQLAELRKQSEVRLTESHTKLEAQQAKTDTQLKKLSKLLGDVNNNRSEEAEEFFFRILEKNPQIGQIKFDTIYRNFGGSRRKIQDEFDFD